MISEVLDMFFTVIFLLLSFHERSRKFHFQRNLRDRNQYGKGIGKNNIEPEIPEDVSKLRMIMRPLGFTLMVCFKSESYRDLPINVNPWGREKRSMGKTF